MEGKKATERNMKKPKLMFFITKSLIKFVKMVVGALSHAGKHGCSPLSGRALSLSDRRGFFIVYFTEISQVSVGFWDAV